VRKGEPPLPILVLEKFACYEMPGARRRQSAGAGVSLFGGWEFDLDTGQVVPPGQGGDIALRVQGNDAESLKLECLEGATLWSVVEPPLTASAGSHRPTPGKAVVPSDFAGRYHLEANGQWTGQVELAVGDGKVITGTFRSDQTGEVYRISGEAGYQAPQRVVFAVELPRTRLEFDGRLWTDGKQAISGLVNLDGRDYGFCMRREEADEPERAADPAVPAFVPIDTRERPQ
jgi:hypothetical protein